MILRGRAGTTDIGGNRKPAAAMPATSALLATEAAAGPIGWSAAAADCTLPGDMSPGKRKACGTANGGPIEGGTGLACGDTNAWDGGTGPSCKSGMEADEALLPRPNERRCLALALAVETAGVLAPLPPAELCREEGWALATAFCESGSSSRDFKPRLGNCRGLPPTEPRAALAREPVLQALTPPTGDVEWKDVAASGPWRNPGCEAEPLERRLPRGAGSSSP